MLVAFSQKNETIFPVHHNQLSFRADFSPQIIAIYIIGYKVSLFYFYIWICRSLRKNSKAMGIFYIITLYKKIPHFKSVGTQKHSIFLLTYKSQISETMVIKYNFAFTIIMPWGKIWKFAQRAIISEIKINRVRFFIRGYKNLFNFVTEIFFAIIEYYGKQMELHSKPPQIVRKIVRLSPPSSESIPHFSPLCEPTARSPLLPRDSFEP